MPCGYSWARYKRSVVYIIHIEMGRIRADKSMWIKTKSTIQAAEEEDMTNDEALNKIFEIVEKYYD